MLNISKNRVRTKFIQEDIKGNLYCYKCENYKNKEEYDLTNLQSCHFRYFRDRRCKECKKNQYLKRRKTNRGKQDLDRLLLERWHGLVERAKKKGLIVDFKWNFLKELYIKQKGKCAVSNIEMTYEMFNGRTPTNVSVDRIDSSIGYLQSNIQLVCMAVNQMKSDLDIKQLIYFCTQIIETNENKN